MLTTENACASVVTKGSGICRECKTAHQRNRIGAKPRNFQHLGAPHTFSTCGCSGILPDTWSDANKFATRATNTGGFGCRAKSILDGSQASARRDGGVPINTDTPHEVIRKFMEEPNCYRCKELLDWSVVSVAGSKAPHLHHNPATGKIYGFTHPHILARAGLLDRR